MEQAIVIGAGPAGLALAASLRAMGVTPVILDKENSIGSAWRRHYDRLHLDTDKKRSPLQMRCCPDDAPRYVPRDQVVAYLEDYADHFALSPQLNAEVTRADPIDRGWRVTLADGPQIDTPVLPPATGISECPTSRDWPALATSPGPILHTPDSPRPADLPGQRVLVVGFGNSGGEIAIDLAEDGRQVDLVVRSAVNLLPKELFGLPIGNFELLQKILPYRWADRITAPVLKLKIGDYGQYGLRKSPKGPITQIREDGRIPLIDLGTLALMKAGKIKSRPGLDRIDGATVTFTDGSSADYDAILMATGYRVDLRPLFGDLPGVLDDAGCPHASARQLAPGLWFCSYHPVPNGQLREIALQAPRIAAEVADYLVASRKEG